MVLSKDLPDLPIEAQSQRVVDAGAESLLITEQDILALVVHYVAKARQLALIFGVGLNQVLLAV